MIKNETLILGNVISLDTRNQILEAIWIKNGKIKYIGSRKMAKELASKHAKVLDYKSNYIYPGFMDAHCHGFYAGAKLAYFENLNDGQSLKEYIEIMRQRIERDKDASFYVGAGFIAREEKPHYKMLDELENKKPLILITSDGHSAWMNSAAMKVFKVDSKEAVKYWGKDIIRVDENNNPIGYISEGPINGIIKQLTCFNVESVKQSILKWQDFAFKVGLTAYYEAGVNEMICQAYKELNDEGKLKIKVFAGWLIDEHNPDYIKEANIAKVMADKYNCENFKLIGLKIFMDGVVEAHTAWLIDPYEDDSKYTGVKRFKDLKRTTALYKEASKLGFNVHAHCIGDGACKFALDCMEKAQIATGNMDMRNAIAHLQLVAEKDVKRLANLNCSAVVAPLWMDKDPNYTMQTINYIGARRMFYSYPLNSFVENDGILAFHSDYPVSPEINPSLSVYMACERNYPDKELFLQLNPHECISRQEALYGLTYGPAYSVKMEDKLGLMKIGHLANFTVIDKNFLACNIHAIPKSKIVATIVDGEEVYKK